MTANKQNWPEWSTPSEEEEIQLAKILLPHVKILSPDIVSFIANENNQKMTQWVSDFEKLNIRPDIYLWHNSPVTFPGIRRHVGKEEEMQVKKNRQNSKAADAILLDDNSYPKELWSYILRNRKANKKGPENYSLAHVVDHKDYKSRHADEIKGYQKSVEKNLFAGLHSSCANTIWIPNSLLKPTDHKGKLRLLLIQIVAKYYNSVCTILPYNLSLNLECIEDHWKLDKFPEPTIVGTIDGVRDFINYRNSIIDNRIARLHNIKV